MDWSTKGSISMCFQFLVKSYLKYKSKSLAYSVYSLPQNAAGYVLGLSCWSDFVIIRGKRDWPQLTRE
jgi:hypothetical protein